MPRTLFVALGLCLVAAVVVGVLLILSAVSSTDLADGTPAGQGFSCPDGLGSHIFLAWRTRGGVVHGQVWAAADQSTPFTGTQSGDTLTIRTSPLSAPLHGDLQGDQMVLHTDPGIAITCTLTTRTQWRQPGSASETLPPSADDRVAESDVTNALTAAKALFANHGTYDPATVVQQLAQSEPELHFSAGPVSREHGISVQASADGLVLVLASRSAAGRCFYAEDNEERRPSNGGLADATGTQGVSYAGTAGTQATCSAAAVPAGLLSHPGWSETYPA